jgi:hypothetical protein
MFAPLTTDPADDADGVPEGAPAAVVAFGVVPPVVGAVGVVLEHPAIATASTTNMIAMILIREIFKLLPPDMMYMPDNAIPDRGLHMPGLSW